MKKLLDKIKGKGLHIAIACITVVLIVLIVVVLQQGANKKSFDTDALITTTTDASGNTVTHLYKQYSEIFTADTDIPTDTPKSAEIYYAGYVDYDEELLLSLFMDGIETERRLGENDSQIAHYKWADENKKESSSYLIIENGINEVRYNNEAVGDYYEYLIDGFHTHQSIMGSNNMLPLYETVYKTEDLGFMSMEEAIVYVKENIFDKLGYTVSDDVEIYSIDHKTMQSYQESRLAEEIALEGKAWAYEYYKIKDTFTEEDDFYIMCFTVEQSGIKLSGRDYFTMTTGRQMRGANIRVHLNRDGIFYYESAGIMQMGQTETKTEKLLTAQEAIDIAYDLHSGIISTDSDSLAEIQLTSVELTEIEFEYAPTPYNDNYNEIMLVPSWIIMMRYTSADGSQWIETPAINAITGEEIK